MKTDRLASLEAALETWLDSFADERSVDDGYVYPDLAADMARAAAAVYDANTKGQAFYEQENGGAPTAQA